MGIDKRWDLKKIANLATLSKGTSSIPVDETIGHATEEDIKKGLSDEYQAHHNEVSDGLAGKG